MLEQVEDGEAMNNDVEWSAESPCPGLCLCLGPGSECASCWRLDSYSCHHPSYIVLSPPLLSSLPWSLSWAVMSRLPRLGGPLSHRSDLQRDQLSSRESGWELPLGPSRLLPIPVHCSPSPFVPGITWKHVYGGDQGSKSGGTGNALVIPQPPCQS